MNDKANHIYFTVDQIWSWILKVNFFILKLSISIYLNKFKVHPSSIPIDPLTNSPSKLITEQCPYSISTILVNLDL